MRQAPAAALAPRGPDIHFSARCASRRVHVSVGASKAICALFLNGRAMPKFFMFVAFVIASVLVGSFGDASAATAMKVWTQSPAMKVQPTTAPTTQTRVALEGGRRSVEAYQIIVHASGGPLSGVNMTASDFSDGHGHVIARSAVSFFRAAFIDFTGVNVTGGNKPAPASSPTHDGRIPDPLIPFLDPYAGTPKPVGAPFAVAAGANQPVWMDLAIPATAVAGVYQGMITVTAVGQPSVKTPVSLTVWNLTTPDMRSVTTHPRRARRRAGSRACRSLRTRLSNRPCRAGKRAPEHRRPSMRAQRGSAAA